MARRGTAEEKVIEKPRPPRRAPGPRLTNVNLRRMPSKSTPAASSPGRIFRQTLAARALLLRVRQNVRGAPFLAWSTQLALLITYPQGRQAE